MLVLSRSEDEAIMFGDDVEVTIVRVRGDRVGLGITAPRTIPVHRREVYDAIQREEALRMEAGDLPQSTPSSADMRCQSSPAEGSSLILWRQRDESIMIGDCVEVTIVDVRADIERPGLHIVRLGITAPKDIAVHRREIYDAIQREKALQMEAGNLPQSARSLKYRIRESPRAGTRHGEEKEQQRLALQAYVDERVDDNTLVEGITALYRVLSKYHVLCGGSGLTIDDWQTFVRADMPAGVLV